MTAVDILDNIKFILAKKKLFDKQGKEDPELEKIIEIYNICKSSLTDRQKRILELYYEKDLNSYDAVAEIGCCRKTFWRDNKKLKQALNDLLDDDPLTGIK